MTCHSSTMKIREKSDVDSYGGFVSYDRFLMEIGGSAERVDDADLGFVL
jgi:hypothetical protein